MRKVILLTFLILVFYAFNSCTKEPIVSENSDKSENVLKSNINDSEEEIRYIYKYPSNPANPYEYTGIWHFHILKRTKWYLTSYIDEVMSIYYDYEYSKRSCMDILGRQVYTDELLNFNDINTVIRDIRSRYSGVIDDSRLSPGNKAKLQTLINDIINIFNHMEMNDLGYYDSVIREINKLERDLPIPRVPLDPYEFESLLSHENRILLIICSVARHSAYYWFNNIPANDGRLLPDDFNSIVRPIEIITPVEQNALIATAHTLAAIAGAIKTSRQDTNMAFDVRITCSASMTSAVSGF